MDNTVVPPIISTVSAVTAFLLYKKIKDLPFDFITQTDYDICHLLDVSFCTRIASFFTALLIYYCYCELNQVYKWPVKNALLEKPTIINIKDGLIIGAGVVIVSIAINILFGFISITGINYDKLSPLFVMIAMLMTGFTEELMFRALPINALRAYVSEDLLVVLTALFFGYVHSGMSIYYGFSAFVFGLLTGYGFLKYGLYWAAALHFSSNTVETLFYSIFKYKVKNSFMAGVRETPDDDGSTTSFVQLALLIFLKFIGYL